MQVRDFQAIIGTETRVQCERRFGGLPDILLACVGGGSNAMGAHRHLLGLHERGRMLTLDLHKHLPAHIYPGT